MAIADFISNVKQGLSTALESAKVFREKAHSFLSGEDEEYKQLSAKYQPVLRTKVDALKTQQDSDSFVKALTMPKRFFANDPEVLSNPEFQRFLEIEEQANAARLLDIGGISSGLASKIAGKTKLAISMMAKSQTAKDIVQHLKSMNISDDIAEKLSLKVVKMTDERAIYNLAKSAQAVSDIERKVGVRILAEDRGKIAESVNKIIQHTTDASTESIAIKKLTDDFTEKFKKTAEKIKEGAVKPKAGDSPQPLELFRGGSKLDMSQVGDRGVPLTTNHKVAESFARIKNQFDSGPIGSILGKKPGQNITERYYLSPEAKIATKNDIPSDLYQQYKNSNPLTSPEVGESLLGKWAKANGFDGIDYRTLGKTSTKEAEIKILNTRVLKTKAQLKREASVNTKSSALRVAKKATGKVPISRTRGIINKVTGIFKRSKNVKTTEKKVLREKIKQQNIGGKAGKRLGKKLATFQAKAKEKVKVEEIHRKYQNKQETLANFRKSVRQYVSDLPTSVQRKILSQVRFSEVKTGKQLNTIIENANTQRIRVANEIRRKKVLEQIVPLQKLARTKGILKKINMQARKEFGFRNKDMVKRSSKETLDKYKKMLLDAMDSTPGKSDVSNVDWEKVAKEGGVGSSKGKTVLQKIGEGLESGLGIVSTNIRKYGGDKLFSRVREWQFKLNRFSKKAADEMEGFQKGMTKMRKKWFGGKAQYQNMSHALFNQDFARAREIAKKFRFESEIDKVIGILDDIHKRANEAGLKVGKLVNYFPRVVKDYDGLFAAYNEKFGRKGRSYLDKLLNDYANSKYKKLSELSPEERADVLTKALRGYGQGKINVGSVGKARVFREIPVEFLKYYHSPEQALVNYVDGMNKKIALKEMFGLEGAEQESIGAMIDGFNMTPNDAFRLKENLGAILAPHGEEFWAWNKIRKTATLTLLSHISSTIFQIADIGKNMYKHGIGRAIASLFRKKPIKREDMFTEISHEFSDSTVLKKALKYAGFDRLDKLNNEAFMANTFREARRFARKARGNGFKELQDYADVIFRGDKERIGKFMDDIKGGKVTEDTRLYVFNKVLDVDPRALTEMPEKYAKSPNARIFYSMKSYGIKVLDIYRNELRSNKKTWRKAKNLVMLTGYLTAAGATGSQLRDWYNGKDTKLSDSVMNSFLQLMLLSTYDVKSVQSDGFGSAIRGKVFPPTRVIEDIVSDVVKAGDGKGLKSIRNIPVVGSEYYTRVGRGATTIEKNNLTAKTDPKNFRGTLNEKQKQELAQIRKTSPSKYNKIVKEIKWERMGVTSKEKSFASMGVEDGERARMIAKYLKGDADWKVKYARLKKAGIITEDVEKQLKTLLK